MCHISIGKIWLVSHWHNGLSFPECRRHLSSIGVRIHHLSFPLFFYLSLFFFWFCSTLFFSISLLHAIYMHYTTHIHTHTHKQNKWLVFIHTQLRLRVRCVCVACSINTETIIHSSSISVHCGSTSPVIQFANCHSLGSKYTNLYRRKRNELQCRSKNKTEFHCRRCRL